MEVYHISQDNSIQNQIKISGISQNHPHPGDYFPDFTHSITTRTEAEDFDARVTVPLQEILRITGADPLPPDAMGFLVQETKTYLVNIAHTVYFSYSLGLRRPEDFVAARYRRKEGSSLLHQIKRALGLKG